MHGAAARKMQAACALAKPAPTAARKALGTRRRARNALRERGVAPLRGGASQASRAGGVDAAAQGMGVQQEHADGGAAMGVGRECVEMQGGLRASSAAVKRSAWCPWNMVAAAWQEKTGPRSRHTAATVTR